jgi:hypothetical protein
VKHRRVIVDNGHLVEIVVPGLARIDPQLGAALSLQQIPGAFDVGGGEWLAVVPFDLVPQFEGQVLAVIAPRPALGQIGDDRAEAVLRHVLVEHDQIVEDGHDRHHRRDRHLLEDRHARRAVAMIEPQNAALLLRLRRRGGEQRRCENDSAGFPVPGKRAHHFTCRELRVRCILLSS